MFTPAKSLRDQIPRREALQLKIQQANRWALPILLLHLIAIGVLAALLDWNLVINSPLLYLIALGVVVGPFAAQILRRLADKKKEIGDLKETTRFGAFDKHQLRTLFQQTLQKLGLPNVDRIPVYVTADRTLNAYASHLGFGLSFLFPQLNGIYLNRQLLHRFNAAEVQDTMGHELGHYYAYYLKSGRYYLLSCLLGIFLALGITQWVGLDSILGYVLLALCVSVAFFFTTRQRADLVHAIEHLCDDFGAHVNGVEVGINALMKLGAAAEIETTIFFESLLSNQFAKLSAVEIMETLQQAIPYGRATPAELEQAVKTQLAKRADQGASLSGFLKFAWQGDAEAELDQELETQAKLYQKLRNSPRLNWESLLADPRQIEFDGRSLPRLIEMMEANPQTPLFHELPALHQGDTHPSIVNRILYLWYNREGIMSSPALPRDNLL